MHPERQRLLDLWRDTRRRTIEIVKPLATEDFLVQAMADTSPPKWHLAHTTWFFEQFLLLDHCAHYRREDESWGYLFNSYYQSVGQPYARPHRGLLARPTVDEVMGYRARVDEATSLFLVECDHAIWTKVGPVVETGIHHEKQHQELLLTDIKYNFFANPALPAYATRSPAYASSAASALQWIPIADGLQEVGADGSVFSYDNERPRHKIYLGGAELASRPSTQGEYLAFMEDGGYEDPSLWLSDGWDYIEQQKKKSPLYWFQRDGAWHRFTLYGVESYRAEQPVSHLTYYEADAFARWSKARLPTEAEWEVAAHDVPVTGNLGGIEPEPATGSGTLLQIYGDVWEWTSSAYAAYPRFQPLQGALGEYNGKFMVNQYVLRGGSAATPTNHIRVSYRNFFYPSCAWQFSGVRLARDL